MKVKSESEVTQSCPTLRDPVDYSPSSSSVHKLLQVRILEWVAMTSSRGSSPSSKIELAAAKSLQLCPILCDFLGKNTEVGSHFLLLGTFLTQGSNLGLPHCGQSLYHLSHQGSPRKPSWFIAAAAAKSLQSCPTLHDPIDGSPSGSPVPGILQARTLEWVAISFSNA